MKRLIFSALGLLPIVGCTTPGARVEIQGIEQFAEPCKTEPPPLSDEEVSALVQAMPSAEQREREFWAVRDQGYRACVGTERAGREGLLNLGRRFNEAVRER
jgi:hypothetical protein